MDANAKVAGGDNLVRFLMTESIGSAAIAALIFLLVNLGRLGCPSEDSIRLGNSRREGHFTEAQSDAKCCEPSQRDRSYPTGPLRREM
jgi:hypothetical protein